VLDSHTLGFEHRLSFLEVLVMFAQAWSQKWANYICLAFFLALATGTEAAPKKAWVFFDLGENSLVRTDKDPVTGDIASVSWVRFKAADGSVTDSHTYLATLKKHGYATGAIINMPQEWGDPRLVGATRWMRETDPARKAELALELSAAKQEAVIDYFDGKSQDDPPGQPRRWHDPTYPAMEFLTFTRGNVLMPFLDRFRKPMDGPAQSEDELFLYREAMRAAAGAGARAIYMGTDANDIAGARQAGMLTRRLLYRPGQAVQPADYYPSEAQIDALAAQGALSR
jgi:hypothetical protein